MKKREIDNLPLGLYIVYWRTGGYSEAALGQTRSGKRWIAPCNWVSGSTTLNRKWRNEIEAMERVTAIIIK